MTGFQQARPYDSGEPFDVASALANMQGFHKGEQQNALGQLTLQMEQVKAQRAKEAWTLQQEMLKKMTPEQRMAFTYAPEQAGGALAKQLYPEHKPIAVGKEGAVWDPAQNKVVFQNGGSEGGTWSPPAGAGANLANAAPPATTAPPAPASGQPPAGPGTAPPAGGTGTATATAPGAPRRYADAIQSGENTTGNPAQTNLAGTSSAMGNHQFLKSTWLGLMRSKHPELVTGKTDDEILRMRAKPELSAEMADAYAQENAPILQQAGFEVNPVNLALAHRYGPAGAVHILQAERTNPNAPLSSVLPEAELNANKELRNLTIAQGRAAMEKQMAGAIMPGQPLPLAPGGTATASSTSTTSTANPNIRVDADGWETRLDRNGVPVTKGAKPGEFWQRRRIGGTDKDPVYEYRSGGGGAGGPYGGMGDGQYWNVLLTGDPSTPAYAAAYHHLTKPQYVQVSDPNNPEILVTKEIKPQLPPNIRVPTYVPPGGAGASPPADPNAVPPPPPASAVAGAPVATEVPGTSKAPGQTAQDKQKLQSAEVNYAKITEAIQQYRDVIKRTGAHTWSALTPLPSEKATEMNTAYNNLALLAKGEELYNLGVLNGPDLEIIRRTLADPSTFKGAGSSVKELTGQIDKVEQILTKAMAAARKQYGPKPLPGAGGGDGGNFAGMSREDLLAVDPATLNDGQKAAYLNALKGL